MTIGLPNSLIKNDSGDISDGQIKSVLSIKNRYVARSLLSSMTKKTIDDKKLFRFPANLTDSYDRRYYVVPNPLEDPQTGRPGGPET